MALVLGVVGAVIVISLSDWVLFGMLFHDRYDQTPGLWRAIPEGKKIAGSMVFAVVGTVAYFAAARWLNVSGLSASLALGTFMWLAASLPQTVTNTLYLRYSPLLVVSHSIGWLVRLLIAAAAYALVPR